MKRNVTISLDVEVSVEVQKKNLKISKIVNDYLRSYLEVKAYEDDEIESKINDFKLQMEALESVKNERKADRIKKETEEIVIL